MPKYWVTNYFARGRFPEVGQKQKTEKKERKKERLNDGNNNGQTKHGARKPPGPKIYIIQVTKSLSLVDRQDDKLKD